MVFLIVPQICLSQWEPCNNGISDFYNQAMIVKGNDIYIGGTGGIYFSTDYGASWIDIKLNLKNIVVLDILIKDSSLYIGTSTGIYLYDDLNYEWKQLNKGLSNTAVYVIDKIGNDLIAGTRGGVFISSDNGENWEARNEGIEDIWIYKFFVFDSIIIAGSILSDNYMGGGIYISSDKGQTWELSALKGRDILCFYIFNNLIYAGTKNMGIYFTTDSGYTWTDMNENILINTVEDFVSIGNVLVTVAFNGGVLYSKDYGYNWKNISNGLFDKSLRNIGICGDWLIAGTYYGGMFRAKIADLLPTDVVDNQNQELVLYPNPSTDYIEISEPSENHALKGVVENVRIYNVFGELVLSNSQLDNSSSQNSYRINLSSLPAGVYFLNILYNNEKLIKSFIKY